MVEKACLACGVVKPLTDFAKHTQTRTGVGPNCRPCHNAYRRAWDAKRVTPEVLAEREEAKARRRQAAREKDAKRKAAWARENKDRARVSRLRYEARHRARHLTRKVVKEARRRVASKSAIWDPDLDWLVLHEAAELAKRRTLLGYGPWEVDHIVPLRSSAACGLHNAYNVQVVPARWNVKKGNRSFAVFFPIRSTEEGPAAEQARHHEHGIAWWAMPSPGGWWPGAGPGQGQPAPSMTAWTKNKPRP